ncbi:hypothetical protein [Acrocarpospora catenulata]|uniref:hypothetical protein n=1 Tax=Acrocarpospora catenulata TaxID=2836182 RepID=UPI001BDABFB2|nr:hypothetical protein [Acrocarpospora catenulata]
MATRMPRKRRGAGSGVAVLALGVAIAALCAAIVAVVLVVERLPEPVASGPVDSTVSTVSTQPVVLSSPEPSPDEPLTRAGARAAAQRALELYAGGEYGKFWDRWVSEDQPLVRRADYLRRFRECPSPSEGVPWVIGKVAVSGTKAAVTATRAKLTETFTFVHQHGEWRYQLTPDQRKQYQNKSVDRIVADERAAGRCGRGTAG